MVYISSWQEYQEAAEALYEKSPNTVRLSTVSLDYQLTCFTDEILREMEGVRGQAGPQDH